MRKAGREEIERAITTGIVFSGEKLRASNSNGKVKTKAKKKSYITLGNDVPTETKSNTSPNI